MLIFFKPFSFFFLYSVLEKKEIGNGNYFFSLIIYKKKQEDAIRTLFIILLIPKVKPTLPRETPLKQKNTLFLKTEIETGGVDSRGVL